MDDDTIFGRPSMEERLARLRNALELVDVYLTLGVLSEADQQALKQRVARTLESEQAEANRGPFT